jgi:hypothetical protein
MTVRVTSRSVRSLAIASMRYARPFSATSADAVVMRRPGMRVDVGHRPEQVGVDAHRHESHAVEGTPMSAWMSLIEFSLTTTMRGSDWRPALHLHERVPAALRVPLEAVGGVLHLELAVDGDRVVEGDDDRDHLLDLQHAVAEALVVVDEVELADALASGGRARALNAFGSGNTPVENWATSSQSLAGLELPDRPGGGRGSGR